MSIPSLWVALAVAALWVAGCGGASRRYNPSLLEELDSVVAAEVPQECGAGASYGGITTESVVVLHRHRSVQGDRNWIAAMRGHVGSTTRVTARSGRDPMGCLVVQVAADDGSHSWRVRDLTLVGVGRGPGGGDAVPQRCEMTDELADFGLIQPGARVVLHQHRPVNGETNWTEEMSDHVGGEAEVVEVGGVDAEGCPVYHVDVDDGEWAWRIRDASLVRAGLPQTCERREGENPGHGSLSVGDRVRLGHHRPVRGERNWLGSMEQYVDRIAQVTSLGPPDDQGCSVVHVDLDEGARSWRVRDLVLLEQEANRRARVEANDQIGGEIPQACTGSADPEDYGPVRPGARVTLGRHRDFNGDANWDEAMEPFVGRETSVIRRSGADSAGCPGIRVDADNGDFFWRIRDMLLAE
jgi:hypothetical protein